MPVIERSESVDDLSGCLSHLNNAIRELEATVTYDVFPVAAARRSPASEEQQHNCPLDYSHVGRAQPGRQSISRGCPFTSAANAPTAFSVHDEIQVSLAPAQHSSEIRVQKETNLGQPQHAQSASSSGSDYWLQESELDVIVDSRVATCEDDTLSETSSRNIYHFSREPDGNFKLQSESSPRPLSVLAVTAQGCLAGSDVAGSSEECNAAAEMEQGLAKRIVWEHTTEMEQEVHGPGPLRKVRSRENIRAFRPEGAEEPQPSGSDQQLLDSLRDARLRIKGLRDDLKSLAELNEQY